MYPVISSALKKGAKAPTRVLLGTVRNTSSVHGNDPVLIEREKKKSLSKSRIQTSAPVDSAEGWNEFLATDSEVFVKADRNTGVSMADLQERTVTHMRSARQEDEELLDQDGTDGLPDHAEK
ncbi:uncharacterized protein EV420DRAFT_1646538 [Desarmillaria tabescens]|uniref:Uncharacterized protein n=1 Tax=Armillaria tabescens TaxID=1929756 RepID=A0AA39K167_ARMTA|nr:uncharacterized protein EV420DRAFT_1646538 [Desarmillaria tabescens]KAK0450298.1 hypothetical protein EV420DRAFT_1646538 [Desarmillaria tabescens]